jgi:hypothetical protein
MTMTTAGSTGATISKGTGTSDYLSVAYANTSYTSQLLRPVGPRRPITRSLRSIDRPDEQRHRVRLVL